MAGQRAWDQRIFNFAIGETLLDIPVPSPNDSASQRASGLARGKGLVFQGMTIETITGAALAAPHRDEPRVGA
jgi:hypothetical protein